VHFAPFQPAGLEVHLEAELVVMQEDRSGSEDRAGEHLVARIDQRAVDEVKDRDGMVQNTSLQIPAEFDDVRAALDHSRCRRRLRMNDRRREEMNGGPGDGSSRRRAGLVPNLSGRIGQRRRDDARIGCHRAGEGDRQRKRW
jgi:hypothetical protein